MRSVNVFGKYSYLLQFHNILPYPVSQFDFSVKEIKQYQFLLDLHVHKYFDEYVFVY